EGDTGNETLVITKQSSPPLQAGTYYFAIGEYPTSKPATGTIVVTFDSGAAASVKTSGAALQSGVAASYSLPAVPSPTLFAGSSAYRVAVDSRHTALRVSVKDNAPGTHVALFVRRGQQPAVVNGHMIADFVAVAADNQQEIVLDGADLKPGVYYI